MGEKELIQRVQNGDTEAFCALVESHRDSLIHVAYGFLHDKEEAMDAAQEVLLKAYRKIQSFKFESTFYTWVYRILVNHCKDRLRKKARKPTVSIEDLGQDGKVFDLPDHRSNPGERSAAHERDQLVRNAIDSLPEKHSKILLLRELGGLSYKEIAQVMKCQEGTVMSRLFHARKLLAQKLESIKEDLL